MANNSSFRGRAKKPFDLNQTIGKFKWKILLWGFVGFVLLCPLAVLMNSSHYIATGTLRIAPTMPGLLKSGEEHPISEYYQDYVQTQVTRLSQVQILMAALNRLPKSIKDDFVEERSLLETATALKKSIKVFQIPQTHLVSIQLKGQNPEGLAELVNSVINVYLERVQEEGQGADNRRLTYLKQERKQLEAKIIKKTKELRKLSREAGVASFQEQDNTFKATLKELQGAYLAAQTRKMESKSKYESALKEAEAIRAIPIEGIVDEETNRNPVLANTKLLTTSTLIEMESNTTGVTSANPDRRFIDRQREGLEEYVQSLEEDIRSEQERILTAKRNLELEEGIVRALYEYKLHHKVEEDLRAKVTEMEQEVNKQAELYQQGHILQQELLSLGTRLESLEGRIYNLQVESKAPGRTSLESIARSLKHDKLITLLALAAMLSFGGMAGFYIRKDYIDQVIRSKLDVENAIGSSPSWPIPDYRLDSCRKAAFSRVTIEDPASVPAKAIRSLAVKLNKARTDSGARVAVFTGINTQAGTSSILMNCAYSMAQLCDRVLVVDMNRQHPQVRELAESYHDDNGLIDAIDSNLPLSEFVVHDVDRHCDVLLIPEGASNYVLDRGKFARLLTEARDYYDIILIDSEPLLSSDLTEFLMTQADIAVPVILGNRSRFPDLYQTIRILWRLQVSAIAPVLNWISLKTLAEKQKSERVRSRKSKRRRLARRQQRRRMKRLRRIHADSCMEAAGDETT